MLLPLSLVMAAALTASPRPLPNADSGIYIPRLDKVGGVVAFMEKAGERSVMLRPSTWFADFHPLLYLDFTRAESLKAAGLDVTSSATVSFRKEGRMTCVELEDPKVFEERARERLAAFGTLWEGKLSGAPVVAAKTTEGTFVAGYARKGKLSCAVLSQKDAKPLLDAAAAVVGANKSSKSWGGLAGLKGELFLVMMDGGFGLSGDATTLKVDGRVKSLPVPELQKGQLTPYAMLKPTGLMVARASVKPSELPGAVQSLTGMVGRVCSKCDREATAEVAKAVAAQLTGNMAVAIQSLNIRGRMRSDADRFSAARQVWLAEVKDAAKLKKALAPLAKFPGASEVDGGWVIPVDVGEVRVVQVGDHVLLANDLKSLEAVKAALPSGRAKMEHAAELVLDPQKTSNAMAGISLFDVMGSKELAGLFALSTEVGPLLAVTKSVEAFADPEGKQPRRVGLVWTLK